MNLHIDLLTFYQKTTDFLFLKNNTTLKYKHTMTIHYYKVFYT